MELDLFGSKIYPGSRVNVNWGGEWYDGAVVKIGPQYNLCKLQLIDENQNDVLLEATDLKPLDTKFGLSHERRVAFNDGESWKEVLLMSTAAVGAAKISWRKDIYSAENETWFEKSNIAPIIRSEAYHSNRDILQAGKSGILPAKIIDQQPRTVNNILYDSHSESEESEFTNFFGTMRTEPIISLQNTSTPKHVEAPPSLPEYYGSNIYAPSWRQNHGHFTNVPPFPPSITSLPPKNFRQSSVPCLNSYRSQCVAGIAPHYSSNFFHGLQKINRSNESKRNERRKRSLQSTDKKSKVAPFHQLLKHYQSRDTTSSAKKGKIHSLYDQFVLQKDSRMKDSLNSEIQHTVATEVIDLQEQVLREAKDIEEDISKNDQSKTNVQEFLDAIVDEINLLDDDGHSVNESSPHGDNMGKKTIPDIILTTELSSEHEKEDADSSFKDMEQYLVGYGDNYGQSSTRMPESIMPKLPGNDSDEDNSIKVHTSLNSSLSDVFTSDIEDSKAQILPTAVESFTDQIERLQMSIKEYDKEHDVNNDVKKKKKWFKGLFRT